MSQSEWEKLIAIRGEAREHCRSTMLAEFLHELQADSSAAAATANQAKTDLSDDFASDDNLRLLQKIEDSYPADSEDERKVRRLRHYLISIVLKKDTQEVERYLTEMRAQGKVKLGDRSVGIDELQQILATETDRDLRQQAYYAWVPELQKENAVIEELIRIEDSTAFDLGYGDLTSICQERQQLDYNVLSEQAHLTIQRTDSLFRELAEDVVPKLSGLKYEMLRGYDVSFLAETSPFDQNFRSQVQLDRCGAALNQMGLAFSDAARPQFVRQSNGVRSRPATYPVTIPNDIRVIMPADSGHWATSALMHEIGHALHWVNTEEREFEFTQLGAGALKEAYAFLIEGLLDEAEVAEKIFGIPHTETGNFMRQRAYVQLLAVRSYCGDLLFEQEVYAGTPDLRNVFERIKGPLGDHSWNEVDRELLYRRLDRFASAEYLTGWFLAAQLREHLRKEFGDRWFASPEAGAFLKDLWKFGTRKSELEIAASLGDSAIAPHALIRHLSSLSSR